MDIELHLKRAAEVIGNADALLVTAGAGIVDSGLPDFRGDKGFDSCSIGSTSGCLESPHTDM